MSCSKPGAPTETQSRDQWFTATAPLEGPGVADLPSQSTSGVLGPGLVSPHPKALVGEVNNEDRPHSYPMFVLGLFLSKSDLSSLLKHFCG